MYRYSLADYILSITAPANEELRIALGINNSDSSFTIGGDGDAIGSISLNLSNNLYSTEGFVTGAWIHSKNLSRVGTCSVQLSQLAPQITKLKVLFNVMYRSPSMQDVGITMTLTAGNEIVATMNDCVLQAIPSQEFGNTAGNQTWQFSCGEIIFN